MVPLAPTPVRPIALVRADGSVAQAVIPETPRIIDDPRVQAGVGLVIVAAAAGAWALVRAWRRLEPAAQAWWVLAWRLGLSRSARRAIRAAAAHERVAPATLLLSRAAFDRALHRARQREEAATPNLAEPKPTHSRPTAPNRRPPPPITPVLLRERERIFA